MIYEATLIIHNQKSNMVALIDLGVDINLSKKDLQNMVKKP